MDLLLVTKNIQDMFFRLCVIVQFFLMGNLASAQDNLSPGQYNYDDCKAIIRSEILIVNGYKFSDIDTIKMVTYKRGTNFSFILDSIYVYPQEFRVNKGDSTFFIHIPPLSTDLDFELAFNNGRKYRVSDIIIAKRRRPHHFTHHNICVIVSRKVNGIEQYRGNIDIEK